MGAHTHTYARMSDADALGWGVCTPPPPNFVAHRHTEGLDLALDESTEYNVGTIAPRKITHLCAMRLARTMMGG